MKKKILLLSDDLRFASGVGVMSKEIVLGTVDKYDWIQLGAGINHPELGKIIDMNDDVRKLTGVDDANVKIIPYNGYGDIYILRQLIKEYKPDAILHFTDPHYWQWVYDNEHEIRQSVPLLFYHVWDNVPDPIYNRDYYESCDWIGCISKLTYGIVNRVGKRNDKLTYKPLKDWQISYVPHGINSNTFKPLENVSPEMYKSIHVDKEYDFILFYNNRNMRRKLPGDLIYSFKLFCDKLSKEEADKCLLLMHTSPIDENGTDLVTLKNDLCPDYNVRVTTNIKFTQTDLNTLYNIVDCTINIAHSEGFGLSTAESLMAGTPIIVNVTGGLQDQCGFDFTAEDYITIKSLHEKSKSEHLVQEGEWCIPIWSSSISLNGTPTTPYIFEDRVNYNDITNAIMKMYGMTREERKSIGLKGRQWIEKAYNSNNMCKQITDGIETTLANFSPRKKFELYKII